MAVEQVTGATPAWFVEYDAAPSKILAHHWPDVPNHGDVTKVDWETMPTVDIITGGSPCQDLSAAGKRAGMTEGTRSNLWVNMREAIRIIRPRLVVWENVQGALSAKAASDSDMEPGARPMGNQPGGHLRALGRVLGDLAEIGYDAQWTTIRASDVGAPHHRARVFLIAWQGATDAGHEPGRRGATDDSGAAGTGPHGISVQRRDGNGPRSGESGQDATDSEGSRRDHGAASHVGPANREKHAPRDDSNAAADTDSIGGRGEPVGVTECGQAANPHADGQGTRGAEPQGAGHADPDSERRDGRGTAPEQEGRTHAPTDRHRSGIDFGPYAAAVRRWERLTRPAPAPTELNRNGKPRLNAEFASWMMGLPEGHVTQVPGISRADQLKAIGNGVCPQQAAAALTKLLEMEGI